MQRWKPVAREIRSQARLLYRAYHLELTATTRTGLFIAGTLEDMKKTHRDRMMILVFELDAVDITRWPEIDADVRALLEPLDTEGDHGICVRYYVKDTLPTPMVRSNIRLDDARRHNERLLLPLRDPYVEDHPSARRMPQVRLPTDDTRRRPPPSLPQMAALTSSDEAALQRTVRRPRAEVEPSHSDRSDSVDPPIRRSERIAARHQSRRDTERKEDETGSGSESETRPQTQSIARRYRRLARRIDRELQYNLENILGEFHSFSRMMNVLGLDTRPRDDTDTWSNDGVADGIGREENVEAGNWSEVDSDPEGDNESDFGEADGRLGAQMLPRIDARDTPAATNRAVMYLRQLTTRDYERLLGSSSR